MSKKAAVTAVPAAPVVDEVGVAMNPEAVVELRAVKENLGIALVRTKKAALIVYQSDAFKDMAPRDRYTALMSTYASELTSQWLKQTFGDCLAVLVADLPVRIGITGGGISPTGKRIAPKSSVIALDEACPTASTQETHSALDAAQHLGKELITSAAHTLRNAGIIPGGRAPGAGRKKNKVLPEKAKEAAPDFIDVLETYIDDPVKFVSIKKLFALKGYTISKTVAATKMAKGKVDLPAIEPTAMPDVQSMIGALEAHLGRSAAQGAQ